MPLTLVGSLLQLLEVGRLLDDVEDGDSQVGVGEGEGLGVDFGLRESEGGIRGKG